MHLEFHGAARTVTGSRHLLHVNGHRVLLDCGLFQGKRAESDRLNRQFGFLPKDVDAVVMSHAHIDHSGALPSLVKQGFQGSVHGTLATADLLTVMLRDSAFIQEKDIVFLNKRRRKRKEPPKEPLYTVEDADRTLELLEGHRYHRPVPVVPGITATFYDAGHILGSAVVQLDLTEGNHKRRLVFTGDLGRKHLPILRDPETPPEADALIIESTYGDREHDPIEMADQRLAEIIRRVFQRKGKLIIPSFAVGRTQELVYAISRLMRAERIPECSVYVDSPMAVNVTEIFARHPETYDEEIRKILRETGDPFGFRLLKYVRSVDESKELNVQPGPFLVISASGMMEAPHRRLPGAAHPGPPSGGGRGRGQHLRRDLPPACQGGGDERVQRPCGRQRASGMGGRLPPHAGPGVRRPWRRHTELPAGRAAAPRRRCARRPGPGDAPARRALSARRRLDNRPGAV
jgi:metallo-beta-lactamase family protein